MLQFVAITSSMPSVLKTLDQLMIIVEPVYAGC